MLFVGGALIVGGWGFMGRGRKSRSHFHSLCYSRKWGRGVSPRFHIVALVWIKITKRQGDFKIPLCNPSGGKVLPKASASYAKLLGKVAFRVLPNIHGESPPPCPGENNPNDQHPRWSSPPPLAKAIQMASDWTRAVNVGCR